MRTEVIQADTIDAAVERVLDELKDDTSARSRENVIYLDGWDGLGVSSVLQAVAQRLDGASASKEELARAGLHFEKIIHIDCTKWQSRRAMQRLIVQQLGLPASVMEVLDKQDEEDDYNGADLESRDEIPQVVRETYQSIQNHRFLVLFHNGSSDEIDLTSFGFHLYSSNKVLWTFQGSFRLKPRMEVERVLTNSTGTTGVFLVIAASRHGEKQQADPHVLWSYLVRQEAVAARNGDACRGRDTIDLPAQVVAQCFLYVLKLCHMGRHSMMDYDLETHSSNYCVCDGIILLPQQDNRDVVGTNYDDVDESWREADALQREMLQLDADYYHHGHQHLPYHLVACAEITPCWTSPTYGIIQMLDGATHIEGMFQHFDKIAVLKLSRCTFSFSSPPFLCCHNLRFLWLDHCQDQDQVINDTDRAAEAKAEDIRWCFQRLWVLDVRHTRCDQILSAQMLDLMDHLRELNVKGARDWDMGQLQGRLPNIRKLRVTKSTVGCSSNLVLKMNKMELLELSGNRTIQGGVANLCEISASSNRLETVIIIDGCVGVKKFSFRGCAKLKNLLLSGWFDDLGTLDLSGTAVKTLDLSAITAQKLDVLFMDDCENLCAILWPPEDKRKSYIQTLDISTTQSAASLSVAHGGRVPSQVNWCMFVRDARLLRSFALFEKSRVQVEISSPTVVSGSGKDDGDTVNSNERQHVLDNVLYADVVVTSKKKHLLVQASQGSDGGDRRAIAQIWPCPPIPSSFRLLWYLHIQDRQLRREAEGTTTTGIAIPDSISHRTYILHVHDSLSITSIPGPTPALGSGWDFLQWCRVERCPKLECVFTTPQLLQGGTSDDGYAAVFPFLETFWASQLPEARYIWNYWSVFGFRTVMTPFGDLTLLHLDLCPRVIHVLPLVFPSAYQCYLDKLVKVEIVWCGDLREVFPLHIGDNDARKRGQQQYQQHKSTTVEFKSVRHIHLHELPKLRGICGSWRMSAPALETVKIRGCWSLKRLPAISSDRRRNKVECDCEKEWWDELEWDGLGANHDPSLYKPTHSRYYKKTMLRGSVLL